MALYHNVWWISIPTGQQLMLVTKALSQDVMVLAFVPL